MISVEFVSAEEHVICGGKKKSVLVIENFFVDLEKFEICTWMIEITALNVSCLSFSSFLIYFTSSVF